MAFTFRSTTGKVLPTLSAVFLVNIGNILSPFMPNSALGCFALIFLFITYLLLFVYFPAILIIYDQSIKDKEIKLFSSLMKIMKCKFCKIIFTAPKIEIVKLDSDDNQNPDDTLDQGEISEEGASLSDH